MSSTVACAVSAARSTTATGPPSAPRSLAAGGTYANPALLWVRRLAAGAVGWNRVQPTSAGRVQLPGWAWISVFVALGFAMVTIFKPKAAPITAPLYAIAEGLFLGVI